MITPILRVMVCPSLKPRSSLGVVSGACACLVSSSSCLTHLDRKWTEGQGRGSDFVQEGLTINWVIKVQKIHLQVQIGSKKQQLPT